MVMKRVPLLPLLLVTAALWTGCSKDEITTSDETGENHPSEPATGIISWSASACTVTYGDESTYIFPSLDNPGGQAITYTSSNEGVATLSATGSVTITGQGETTVTAVSEASGNYRAATASYTLTVEGDLAAAGISWSAATCSAILEETGNTFPTLDNPNGLSVSYSSSDTSVATVSDEGVPTLLATGTATIYATTAATDRFAAGSASYTLTVTSNVDDGAGNWTFASTGDPTSEDDIATAAFTRMVTVTFGSTGATVSGYSASPSLSVSVSGNQVTVTNSGDELIIYKLTGTASDGFFKLYSTRKQALLLSDLSLTCTSGAAINNQSGKRTYVVVEGTNTLADGSSAAYSTTGDEDMKAVFFSEGQLCFSGSGSLKVTANNAQRKSAIVSDDYVRFLQSPTVTVSCGSGAGHGIKANEYVRVDAGTLSLSLAGGVAYDSEDKEYKGTDGIKADNYFAMTGGSVTIKHTGNGGKGVRAGSYDYDATSHKVDDTYISGGTLNITTTGSESNDVSAKGMKIGWVTKSGNRVTGYAGNLLIKGGTVIVSAAKSEGIEAKGNIVISGGETYVYSTGDDAINSQAEFDVTGGYVYAHSTANDAMDANHDMKISGGYVFAVTTKGSPEVALDANTEENYKLYITGGVVVAYGGLERGYSSSNTVYTLSGTAGAWNALYNGSSFIAAFKAPSNLSSFAVCAPSLSKGYKGVTVSGTTFCNGIWATSDISGGTAVSLTNYSGGSGGGPGGGGRW